MPNAIERLADRARQAKFENTGETQSPRQTTRLSVIASCAKMERGPWITDFRARSRADNENGRGRDEDFSSRPAQIPGCAASGRSQCPGAGFKRANRRHTKSKMPQTEAAYSKIHEYRSEARWSESSGHFLSGWIGARGPPFTALRREFSTGAFCGPPDDFASRENEDSQQQPAQKSDGADAGRKQKHRRNHGQIKRSGVAAMRAAAPPRIQDTGHSHPDGRNSPNGCSNRNGGQQSGNGRGLRTPPIEQARRRAA
jgi:hypothetical protein